MLAVVGVGAVPEAQLGAQRLHRLVADIDIAPDLADALGGGVVEQPGHQRPAQPLALEVAARDHRVFGALAVRVRRQPRHPHQRAVLGVDRHEGHGAGVIDLGEARDLALRQLVDRAHEAKAAVLIGQPVEERLVERGVLRQHRAHPHGRAVGQRLGPVPLRGVGAQREARVGAALGLGRGPGDDARVERDHARGVGQQRVHVHLDDLRKIRRQPRQPHQRQRHGVDVGRRTVAIARHQLADAGLLDHVARQRAVERRQRQRLVGDHLHRHAPGAEQHHRAEGGVFGHAQNQLMRVLAPDHRLHRQPVDLRVGPRLARSGEDALGGGGGLLSRVQVQPHAADVGFMGDVARQDLDRHRLNARLQHPPRDLARLLRRACGLGFGGGHAVGAQHRLGLRLGQRLAPLRQRGRHRRLRGRVVGAEIGRQAGRHAPQRGLRLVVIGQIGKAARGFGGGVIARQARSLEPLARHGGGRLAQPVGQDRLARTLTGHGGARRRQRDHPLGDHVRGRQRGGAVHHQHRIDLRIVEQRGDRSLIAVGVGVADHVHRVGVRPGGRQGGVERGHADVRQRRQPDAALRQRVHRQHPGAAAVGDDAQTVGAQRRHPRQRLGGGEQALQRLDPQHARAAEGGFIDRVGPGQRPGMRGRRLGRRRRAACLDHDHRFYARAGAGGGHELSRVGDLLQIHDHRVGGPVGGEVVEHVAHVHVRHVAQRGDHGKADAARRRPVEHRGDDGARLRQQRQIARRGGDVGETCVQPDIGRLKPDAVRPQHAQQMGLRRVQHRLPQPVLARQPRRDHHRRPRAFGAKFTDEARHAVRRRDDHAEVGRRGQIGDACVAGMVLDGVVFRVDQMNVALEAAVQQLGHHGMADRPAPGARPDQRDRLWRQKRVEIADSHRLLRIQWDIAVQHK